MMDLREKLARVAHPAIASAADFNDQGPDTWEDGGAWVLMAYETADRILTIPEIAQALVDCPRHKGEKLTRCEECVSDEGSERYDAGANSGW